MKTSPAYWDNVSQILQKKPPDKLWRRHSDMVGSRLLARWLPDKETGRCLKTDMSDESMGDGIQLPGRAVNWTFFGMDIAVQMLRAARRLGGYRCLAVTDIRRSAFVDNAFDVIFSNSTLDHFNSEDQIAASFGECHRILKPGGRFVLTMDNPLNPVIALRQILPYRLLVRVGITTFYYGKTLPPRTLIKMLTDAGFTIENVEPVLHCPRLPAILAARIVGSRAPAGVRKWLLEILGRFEKLRQLPTRYLSGYYTAVCCRKAGPGLPMADHRRSRQGVLPGHHNARI